MTLPKLYSEQEAAEQLGIETTTLLNARRRGMIGWTKLGRAVKYTEQQLIDFINKREKRPCVESQNLQNSLMQQETLNPLIGTSNILTEKEASVAQRAVKSARKTLKRKFSSHTSYSSVNALPSAAQMS